MYSYRYIWAWVLEKRPFFHEKSALWWLLSQLGSPHFRFMSFQNEIFTNIFELAFQNKKDHFFSCKIRLGISIINRNFEVHIVAFWAFKNKYFYQYIWDWILEVKGMFSWKINLLRIIINRNFGFHILAFWDFKNKYFYQYVWF